MHLQDFHLKMQYLWDCVRAFGRIQGSPFAQAVPPLHHPHFNLGPDEDVRHVRHAVLQFRDPLLLDVVIRGRVYDREADEKHVGVGVGEWPQLVVILLWGEQRRIGTGWAQSPCSPWDPRSEGSTVAAGEPCPSLCTEVTYFPFQINLKNANSFIEVQCTYPSNCLLVYGIAIMFCFTTVKGVSTSISSQS